MCGSRRKKQCCAKYRRVRDFKSHLRRDFLADCIRPVSVHLAMASVGCSFESFSVFLLSLKQQENRMKIMFSYVHYPIWPYPPPKKNTQKKTNNNTHTHTNKINKQTVFYTRKLYGLTGMQFHPNLEERCRKGRRLEV